MTEANKVTGTGTGTEVAEGNTKPRPKNGVKSWCFTINNYTEREIDELKAWGDMVNRLIVSKEVGEQGTPHLQGFVTFKRSHRFEKVKKLMPRAWLEPAKTGDADLYCAKLGSEVIIDNRRQGERTDLIEIQKEITEGTTEHKLWVNHFPTMVKFHKGVVTGMMQIKRKREGSAWLLHDYPWEDLKLAKPTILWGATGIGKTQFAMAHFTNPLVVRHMDTLLELTEEHDGIVFDDMHFKHLPRATQIYLVDWELDAQIHCRYRVARIPARTKRIFTTNDEGGHCIDINDAAILRRVEIVEVKKFEFINKS